MSAASIHLLRQLQRDPRLAWLIGPGSQSYDLITSEVAAAAGQDVQELRARVETTLQTRPWPRSGDITDQQLDEHLDTVLRASGSALRHYTLHKSREDMREALRAAICAAIGE